MGRKLRSRIVARLLLVSVLLSALAGTAVFVLERKEIDDRVLQLALDESHGLGAHVAALDAGEPQRSEERRRELDAHLAAEHVAAGHFVLVELYDLRRVKVAEARHPDFGEVERAVNRRQHAFMLGEELVHERLAIGGQPFVQVFAPLREGGRTVAYFEGVYRIDPVALRSMNRGLALSVLLVVVVIFATALVLYPVIIALSRDMLKLSADLAHANMGMLAALGSAVAKRDRGTSSHNYRVTIYAIRLAEKVGLSAERIRGLIKGAFLHDVGKIGIADAILQKPERLTRAEADVMQAHVTHGVEIVGKYAWLEDSLDVVQFHHERFDGGGYPAGLQGQEIPVTARIFTIVDVFDALTTRRPYKEPAPLEVALATLEAGRGTAFDPWLLDAFAELAPELHRTVLGDGERELARMLDPLLVRYFSSREGARAPRGPVTLARAEAAPLDYLTDSWSLARPPGPMR